MIVERGGEDASSMDRNYIEVEVFSQLMGAERYGRVRGYDIGITPTQLSAMSRFTQESRDGSVDVRVHRLEHEIVEPRQTHDADRAEVQTLRQTRDTDRAEIQTMRAQLQQLMHMFMPSQISHYI